MAYIITDSCTNCGECEKVCPSGAVTGVGDRRAIIMQRCIECGDCVEVCRDNAIIRV